MKKSLIAANWKSNKTKFEAKDWLMQISSIELPQNLEVIIFSPFTLLDVLNSYIKVNGLPFKLGAQDVSPFDNGPYTGEVSAKQIKEFADYVLIGHSERRANFAETDEMIARKVERAISDGITPIICVSQMEQLNNLPSSSGIIIAYEPISAIGSGNPEDPKKVLDFVSRIKANFKLEVIYGGSVTGESTRNYLDLENISGVLVGGDSLDSLSFINILKNAI